MHSATDLLLGIGIITQSWCISKIEFEQLWQQAHSIEMVIKKIDGKACPI